MIDLYLDFDGVIKDTINFSYKMMRDLGINLKDRASVVKFYQEIDWNFLLANSDELNDAFKYIDMICEEGVFRLSILTTVNSLSEMIAKTKYIRSKNTDVGIICVPNGVLKNQIVNANGAILVDDYSTNLFNWVKAGGIGVKFGFDEDYISIDSLHLFVDKRANKNLCLRK